MVTLRERSVLNDELFVPVNILEIAGCSIIALLGDYLDLTGHRGRLR